MGRKAKTTSETPAVKETTAAKKVIAEASKTADKKTETAPKAAAKKAPAKTAPAKAAAKSSVSLKTSLSVQYQGKDFSSDDLFNAAKDVWSKDTGKKIADLKSLDLYVKPEENKVYYVANGNELGSYDL